LPGFAALALLFSSVEVHSSSFFHSSSGEAESIAVDASHAEQSAHFETSESLEIPHCISCTNRSRQIAISLRYSERTLKQEDASGPRPDRNRRWTEPIFRTSSPRAPPLI
jgi:hypothetical protein